MYVKVGFNYNLSLELSAPQKSHICRRRVSTSNKSIELEVLRGLHLIPSSKTLLLYFCLFHAFCLPLVTWWSHLCDLDIDSLSSLKLGGNGAQAEGDSVPPQRHEVTLNVRHVDKVLLARLALEEAVAPGPAEISNFPRLDVALEVKLEIFL